MAKKLKTYETSLGFFELAIAAPSMKAALDAWGADSNLFHQGAAKQSEDPDVVTATMAKPGVVLKRPVGSNGPFKEHAELPTNLGDATAPPSKAARKPAANRRSHPPGRPTRRRSRRPLSPTDGSRSAAIASGRGKRPPGRKSANIGSRPSTRRNRRWTRLNGSMRREPEPSRPRRTLSRRERKPKMPAGKRRSSGWMRRCSGLGARVPT
jgi:hypothetical protein